MAKKSNVIYIDINPNLIWVKELQTFEITEAQLSKKNIKPWKSKDGTKLMYQLFNPVTNVRIVYTRPNGQELIKDKKGSYYKYLPETEDLKAKDTQLHIIHN